MAIAWLALLASGVAHAAKNPAPLEPGVSVLQLQEGAFRMLASNVYRQYVEQPPYEWPAFRASTMTLLQLYSALLIDPACDSNLKILLSTITSAETRPPTSSPWWIDQFLPQSIEAFSCGFDPNDTVPLHELPQDVRDGWHLPLIPQAYRLMRSYVTNSEDKRSEVNNRWQDSDISFYAALFGRWLNRPYIEDNMIRAGAPFYVGNPMWVLFHGLTHRISSFPAAQQPVLAALFRSFMDAFSEHHPCPDCLAHLAQKVMLNDENAASCASSEANFYPVEWLFIGGRTRGNTKAQKLASIVDGPSAELFVWKLHNAITSTIASQQPCRNQENYDQAVPANQIYRCGYWPVSQRFYRQLHTEGLYQSLRVTLAEKLTASRPFQIDSRLRATYWCGQGQDPADWETLWHQLQAAIADLDRAVLDSGVFRLEYDLTGEVDPNHPSAQVIMKDGYMAKFFQQVNATVGKKVLSHRFPEPSIYFPCSD